mgnify:FL=1
MIVEGTPFVNTQETCIVCHVKSSDDTNPMVRQHIRYYERETIAWVHSKCHQKIHDPENPITAFIPFEPAAKDRFDSEKKVLDN